MNETAFILNLKIKTLLERASPILLLPFRADSFLHLPDPFLQVALLAGMYSKLFKSL